VAISTERECEWAAASESDWLTLNASKGQGPGSIGYSAAPNPDSSPRRGALVIGQQRLEIAQEAAPCRYDVVPTSIAAAADETRTSIAIAAPGGCRWSVRSTGAWIRIEPAEGAGSGAVQVSIAQNAGPARSATLTLAGMDVSISQAAPSGTSCSYTVTPTGVNAAATGARPEVSVTTQPGCAWSATPDASWVAVLEGATGSGPGIVRLNIAGNDGGARSATVLVGGVAVRVSQEGRQSCGYSIQPTTASVGREGAEIAVAVTAATNCPWTAASESSWIAVSAGASGSGASTVRLSVAANPGEARSGRAVIAGHTFVVQQAGAVQCTSVIKPAHYNSGRGPDDVSVQVTAPQGCAWTTSGEPAWVNVAEGRTGSATGTVRLLLSANNGGPRAATLLIAGQSFALSQEGSCPATIKPTYYNAGRGPDEFDVAVTAAPGCAWTATSPVDWARIQSGAAGSGTGIVTVRVNPNNGAARSAVLAIGGQQFLLSQEGRQ
jgi:hypothetical protein